MPCREVYIYLTASPAQWGYIITILAICLDRDSHQPHRGYNTIVMFVNCMSKYVYFVPCKSTILVEELVLLFMATVVVRHGMPKQIISDCDGRFLSRFWQTLLKAMGCDLAMSSAYHP